MLKTKDFYQLSIIDEYAKRYLIQRQIGSLMKANTLVDLFNALNFNQLIGLKFKLFELKFKLKEDFNFAGLEVMLSLSLLLDHCFKPSLIVNLNNIKLSKKFFHNVLAPTEVYSQMIILADEMIDQCQNNTQIVMIESKFICVPYNINIGKSIKSLSNFF